MPFSKRCKLFTFLLKYKGYGTLLPSLLPEGHYPTILNPLLSSSYHRTCFCHVSGRPWENVIHFKYSAVIAPSVDANFLWNLQKIFEGIEHSEADYRCVLWYSFLCWQVHRIYNEIGRMIVTDIDNEKAIIIIIIIIIICKMMYNSILQKLLIITQKILPL